MRASISTESACASTTDVERATSGMRHLMTVIFIDDLQLWFRRRCRNPGARAAGRRATIRARRNAGSFWSCFRVPGLCWRCVTESMGRATGGIEAPDAPRRACRSVSGSLGWRCAASPRGNFSRYCRVAPTDGRILIQPDPGCLLTVTARNRKNLLRTAPLTAADFLQHEHAARVQAEAATPDLLYAYGACPLAEASLEQKQAGLEILGIGR